MLQKNEVLYGAHTQTQPSVFVRVDVCVWVCVWVRVFRCVGERVRTSQAPQMTLPCVLEIRISDM